MTQGLPDRAGLVRGAGRSDGAYRNRPLTNLAAIAGMAAVLALNVLLLLQTAGMSL